MQAKFNDAMNTTGFSIAEQVTRGEYYAVLYNSIWHRVQISSPTREDGSVTCFMVDTGELYNVAKDQICNLEPVYMKTKFQVGKIYISNFSQFNVQYFIKYYYFMKLNFLMTFSISKCRLSFLFVRVLSKIK